jgi:general secretion pathway protein F
MVLIGFANFVKDYWWLVIMMIIGGIYWFRRYYATAKGRDRVDERVLHVPIFGDLIRMLAVTRFSRTLATLLSSGVPLLTAFDIVKAIIANKTLARAIDDARGAIQQGESIAAPLKRSGEFPPIVTHMIAVGEKSGQLEDMLFKIADAYDAQVDARLIALTSILEPMIIVVMGLVVGFIVFSIMLPMLQLSSFAK